MKILLVVLLTLLPNILFAKDIGYFDYKFSIPDHYKIIENNLSKEANSLFIFIKDKKLAFSIEKKIKDERFFTLEEHEAKSHRDLFYVLFSDAPSSNKTVLRIREISKNFPLQKQSISKNDRNFVFFRTDNAMDLKGTTFLVSTPKNDEVLKLDFPEEIKEEFIQLVINSIEVK